MRPAAADRVRDDADGQRPRQPLRGTPPKLWLMVNPPPSAAPAVPPGTNGFGADRSTLYLLGAQFLRNLGPLIVLFLLARLTTPDTVGTYSLALAIVTPFFVFAQLGMRTVTLTLRPEGLFRDYAIVQTAGVVLALAAAGMFALWGAPALSVVVLLVGLGKIADVYSDFLSGPLQRHGRSVVVLIASLIAAVVVSAGAAIVLFATRELVPTLATLAVLSLAAAYFCLFRPAARVSAQAEMTRAGEPPLRARLRRIVLAGLPLGIAMSVMSLISTVPQYVVTASYGEAETARLAVLLYVYALADIVTGVVSQAWIPHAQAHIPHSRSRNPILAVSLRSTLLWTVIYIPVTVGGLFLSAWLIPVVFGSAYTLSMAEAVPLGLAVVLLPAAHFLATAVSIRNDYAHALALAIGSTALSVGASIVLIPQLGIAGAFWALFAAVAARAVIAAGILAARGRREIEAER